MANVKHYRKIPLLPDGYTECEYLETTGTQYILLGIKTQTENNVYVSGDFIFKQVDKDNFILGTSNISKPINLEVNHKNIIVSYGDWYSFSNILTKNTLYKITAILKYGEQEITVDSNTYKTNIFSSISKGLEFGLFCCPSDKRFNSNLFCFSCRIEIDDHILNFIPALDPTGRPCMFDTVSQKPFYNQGTGEFLYKVAEKPTMKLVPMVQMYHKGVPYFKDKTLAPRLPEWLQEVEYLESTGTQWIDTGLKWNDITKVEFIERFTSTSGYWGDNTSYGTNMLFYAGNIGYINNYKFLFDKEINHLYKIVFCCEGGNGYVEIDGDVVGTTANGRVVPSYDSPFLIFAATRNGSLASYTKSSVYSYIIHTGEYNLSAILVPCYFKTSHTCIDGNTLQEVTMPADKPCMYDMVTGHCFFNKDSRSDFLVGEDKDTMVEVSDTTGIIGLYSKGEVVRNLKDLSMYIKFEDAEVERVLMKHGVSSDGIGITYADAEKVTSIGTWFRNNTDIESFNELRYFKNVKSFVMGAFYGCTNLKEIDMINVSSMQYGYPFYGAFENCQSLVNVNNFKCAIISEKAFKGCTNLSYINIDNVESIGSEAFRGCRNLIIKLPNTLVSVDQKAFYYVNIVSTKIPKSITLLPVETFRYAKFLHKELDLMNVETLGTNYPFTSALGDTDIECLYIRKVTTLPSGNFLRTPLKEVYLPDIPPTLFFEQGQTLSSLLKNCNLFVSSEAVRQLYISHEQWGVLNADKFIVDTNWNPDIIE